MDMKVIEVNNPDLAKSFIDVALQFYKNDANYIRPLDADIDEVFDPQKNNSFKQGECIRWLLQDASGKYIGRIAAFYTKETIDNYELPTGGCGFFECINNKEAAFVLFETAKAWLESKGLEAMDGPINFG